MAAVELTATAIATLVLTKAFEKAGEKLGEKVLEKSGQLMELLRSKFSNLAETLEVEQNKPVNLDEAKLDTTIAGELAVAAEQDADVAVAITQLGQVAREDSNPKLAQAISSLEKSPLGSQAPTVQNFGQLAEEIKAVFQGNVIQSLTIN